jgi:hypothetical protein
MSQEFILLQTLDLQRDYLQPSFARTKIINLRHSAVDFE